MHTVGWFKGAHQIQVLQLIFLQNEIFHYNSPLPHPLKKKCEILTKLYVICYGQHMVFSLCLFIELRTRANRQQAKEK